jgi:hypothetical protein
VRLPADQPVLPDGTIDLGRYGRLVVAGQTVEQIEAAVQTRVVSHTKDAGPINVRLVSRQSKVFYVLGEVNAPGAFPLTGRETVLDGILIAGGLTDAASRKEIILSRPTPPDGCRVVLPICYEEIVQLGDTSTNYQLAPGDRIFVATRHFLEGLLPCYRPHDCPPCGKAQFPCGPCQAGEGPSAGNLLGGLVHELGRPVAQPAERSEAIPLEKLPRLDTPKAPIMGERPANP